MEPILGDYVRYVGPQRLKIPTGVVIEDPILTPVELAHHQFVLGATQRMKRVGYAKSASGGSHTTCIR